MRLKNKYGNVYTETDNPTKIARLKELGYTEVIEKPIKKEEPVKRSKKNGNKKETE